MAFRGVRLNHPGVAAIAKSQGVTVLVDATAESIAAAARSNLSGVGHPEMQVDVTSYVTDRAAAAVTITHPGGIGVQAKYGILTQAAGDVGVEVTSR